MKKLLLFLLLSITSIWASAETIDPLLAKADVCGRYEVFHINGILTDIDGAQAI